jgi:uncharacterized phage-associated protein
MAEEEATLTVSPMTANRPSIHDVSDFIVLYVTEDGQGVTVGKLQRLLYYIQAYHLALHHSPLFSGRFQAWALGPTNVRVHKRFCVDSAERRNVYSLLTAEDCGRPDRGPFPLESVPLTMEVIRAYAGYGPIQLDNMTRGDWPWQEARGSLDPAASCNTPISEVSMAGFYRRSLIE